MKVFRIDREKHLDSTLSGIGASRTKGFRWNSLNTRMVYSSESRALAILEVAVHLDLAEDLPSDRYYVEIDIPDDITILEVQLGDLPDNWDAFPPTTITQLLGDDFVSQNEAAILKVPSSIVPEEFNYLINPLHDDVKNIKVARTKAMKFDKRLLFKNK
ncbi:MAG TPA: RES domain-containing protein [Leeuwenhoekiella sp.]|nr:RES domain-containing protein [Leeuwenhoekiella sp.]